MKDIRSHSANCLQREIETSASAGTGVKNRTQFLLLSHGNQELLSVCAPMCACNLHEVGENMTRMCRGCQSGPSISKRMVYDHGNEGENTKSVASERWMAVFVRATAPNAFCS